MGTKMACKDDCWEGDYEEAKEQNGCRSSTVQKTSNIPGNGAMVSKLGFFSGTTFLLSTTRPLGAGLSRSTADAKSLSEALSLLQQELLHGH